MGNEWKLWGQSLRGRRHRKKEMMCQDQYACKTADGIIAAWDGNQKIRVISKPQTGRKLNETVLTTSDTALGNVRILKAPLGNTKTFVMATDGFYNNWEDRASLNNVFMHSKKDVRIEERTDDQTVIKIQLTGGENKISMEDYQYGVLLG
jgi:hypothetical protein